MATEPMTLCERLRNPERCAGGKLDEAQAIATMREAANALDGNRILRNVLFFALKETEPQK